ncbi:MAG: MFS transporter [Dehalococcoidia bacterium]|jgi:MFS family permease|nr:MFS transporter [Dehalococcoidia bacterium]
MKPLLRSVSRPWRIRLFYGWYIVAASAILNAYIATAFAYGFQVFFLPLLREFGWSRTATSGAFSLRQVESGVVAPLMGFAVDRFGARSVILAGVILAGAGMLLMSYINSLVSFYATLLIISFGMSGASHSVSWTTVVAKWFRRLRGRAIGLALMGPMVGGPLVILVALLEEALGWRGAMRVLGVGFWVIGIPTALVARSRPEDYGYLPDGDDRGINEPSKTPSSVVTGGEANVDEASEEEGEGLSVMETLQSRVFWSVAVILGVHGLALSGLLVHQVPYFQSLGYSLTQAATTVAVLTAFSGIGRFAAGVLLDAFDWRWIIIGVLVGQTLAIFGMIAISDYWLELTSVAVLGLTFGASISARPLLVGILFGTRAFGSIQGLLTSVSIGAGVIGPVALGWTFDRYGTYEPALAAFSILTLSVVPLAALTGRGSKRFAGPVNTRIAQTDSERSSGHV